MTPSGWDYVPIDGYILNAGVYQLADNFGFTDNQSSVFSYSFNLSIAAIPPPDGDLNADNQVDAGDVLIASRSLSDLASKLESFWASNKNHALFLGHEENLRLFLNGKSVPINFSSHQGMHSFQIPSNANQTPFTLNGV